MSYLSYPFRLYLLFLLSLLLLKPHMHHRMELKTACSNWRSLPMSHLNRSHVHDSTCPCSIWPLVMPFGWDTTNCALLWSVVNIPWLICAACVLHIYYICAIRVALSITGCQTGEQRGLSSVTAPDVTLTDIDNKSQSQTQTQRTNKSQSHTTSHRHRQQVTMTNTDN